MKSVGKKKKPKNKTNLFWKDFFLIWKRVTEGQGDTHTKIFYCWFNPQMALQVLELYQEPEASSRSPMWVQRSKSLGHLLLFFQVHQRQLHQTWDGQESTWHYRWRLNPLCNMPAPKAPNLYAWVTRSRHWTLKSGFMFLPYESSGLVHSTSSTLKSICISCLLSHRVWNFRKAPNYKTNYPHSNNHTWYRVLILENIPH